MQEVVVVQQDPPTQRGILSEQPDFNRPGHMLGWVLDVDEHGGPSTLALKPYWIEMYDRTPGFIARFPDLFPCAYAPDPNRAAHKLSVYLSASRIAYVEDATAQGLQAATQLFGNPATWGYPSPPEFQPPPMVERYPAVEWVVHEHVLRIAFQIFASGDGHRTYMTVSDEHMFIVGQQAPSGPALEYHCRKSGDHPFQVPVAGISAGDCVVLPLFWVQPPGYYAVYPIAQDVNGVWIYATTGQRVDDELNVNPTPHNTPSPMHRFEEGPRSNATTVEAAIYLERHDYAADVDMEPGRSASPDPVAVTLTATLDDTPVPLAKAMAPVQTLRPTPRRAAAVGTDPSDPFARQPTSLSQAPATQRGSTIPENGQLGDARGAAVWAAIRTHAPPARKTFMQRVKDVAEVLNYTFARREEPGKLQRVLHTLAHELDITVRPDEPLETTLSRIEGQVGIGVVADNSTPAATPHGPRTSRLANASPLPAGYAAQALRPSNAPAGPQNVRGMHGRSRGGSHHARDRSWKGWRSRHVRRGR